MNRKIVSIGEKILQQVGLEKDLQSPDQSIGFFEGKIQKQKAEKWILRKPKATTSAVVKNFQGDTVGTRVASIDTIYTPNNTVWRDSPLGGQIIQGVGESSYFGPKGLEISLDTEVYAYFTGEMLKGFIQLKEGDQLFNYENLERDLQRIKQLEDENQQEKLELESLAKESSQAEELRIRIDKRQQEIKTLEAKISQHISQEVALRDQPILDKYQEAVKRSKIFDGPLIINGGPGTGKTTSLIQRISFLTSKTIEESVELNQEMIQVLNYTNPSWVFYSPTELLKEYLSKAMIAEGLLANDNHVRTWENHRKVLVRESGIINIDTGRPFKFKSLPDGASLFRNDSTAFTKLKTAFEAYLIDKQLNRIQSVHDEKLLNILKSFSSIDKELVEDLIRQGYKLRDETIRAVEFKRIQSWIGIYIRLEEIFKANFSTLDKQLSQSLKESSSKLQVRIKNEKDVIEKLREIAVTSGSQDVDQEENEEEEEEGSINPQDAINVELVIDRALQGYLRNLALFQIYPGDNSLSKKNKELNQLLGDRTKDLKIDQLGILLFFRKYFQKPTQGLSANLFSDLFTSYKAFRKSLLQSDILSEEGQNYLKSILQNKNSSISNEEIDFLLFWLFDFVKETFKANRAYYDSSTHPFISCFKQNTRAVIAIDEATDFSIWELAAISGLSHPLISSVTLSGDLMQRLTLKGINSWQDYVEVFPNTEIKDLKIAYRQTARLLDIAATIYRMHINKNAEFKSHFPGDPLDPAPLLHISEDFDEKIDWLAERILEIHSLYGRNFPTVAVFVKDDAECLKVARYLGKKEQLEEASISVVPCVQGQILGDRQSVRVYSIEYIKGLEFGAAFFHDLDNLNHIEKDQLIKYIYVGLSRANLFLGVTLNQQFEDRFGYLASLFKSGTWKKNQ